MLSDEDFVFIGGQYYHIVLILVLLDDALRLELTGEACNGTDRLNPCSAG